MWRFAIPKIPPELPPNVFSASVLSLFSDYSLDVSDRPGAAGHLIWLERLKLGHCGHRLNSQPLTVIRTFQMQPFRVWGNQQSERPAG